jgi:hypothetical protein
MKRPTSVEILGLMGAMDQEACGKMIATAVGHMLQRFGERQITIDFDDMPEFNRVWAVEIHGTGRKLTYRLVQKALVDSATGNLPL